MSRTTLPVCPKTGSTSPSLTVHLCLHTALLREIGNAPLYQRRKGRDLFDLATALEDERTDPERIIAAFQQYMDHGHHHVTRALFERNVAGKLSDPQFGADIGPLLSHGYRWDMDQEATTILERLAALLPSEPWNTKE